jgi:hypothetical protein
MPTRSVRNLVNGGIIVNRRQEMFSDTQRQRFRDLYKEILAWVADEDEKAQRIYEELRNQLGELEGDVREKVARVGIPPKDVDDLVRLILTDACLPQNLRIFHSELDPETYLLGCILYHANEYRYHHGAPDRSFRGLFEGVSQVANYQDISEEVESEIWRTIQVCLRTDNDGYQFSVLFQSSFFNNFWWVLATTMDIYLRVLFYALANLSLCGDFIQLEKRYFRDTGGRNADESC